MAGTVPAFKALLAGTIPAPKKLLAGTKEHRFTDRVRVRVWIKMSIGDGRYLYWHVLNFAHPMVTRPSHHEETDWGDLYVTTYMATPIMLLGRRHR